MGSMVSMKDMAGMDSSAGHATKGGEMAGHDMNSMKDMPGMSSKARNEPRSKGSVAHQDMGSMKGMPAVRQHAADAPMAKEGHHPAEAAVMGRGIVQSIDKANGKVKLTHEPIEALGWPKMTMFFRLKNGSLADPLKEGDTVQFSLEKSATGYVISGIQKGIASR